MTIERDKKIESEMWWWRIWHAQHAMRFPWRATFLLVTLMPALQISGAYTVMVVIGYNVCHFVEHWQKQNALDAIHGEEFGWKPDPTEPGSEENEHSVRLKLEPEHQAIVFRVGGFLRRML